ncbi:MAG: HlyD family secretion protein [Planctomycetota bacterium]
MTANANLATDSWQAIQRVVENLSELAKDTISPPQFYDQLSQSLVDVTEALRCRVWMPSVESNDPPWRVIAEFANPHAESDALPSNMDDLAAQIANAAESSSEIRMRSSRSIERDESGMLSPDIMLQRVRLGSEVDAIIQLECAAGRSASDREGTDHLAAVTAEIAAEFQRNWRYRELADRERRREQLDRFVDSIHRSYDLQRVAYAIVGQGKELLDCDRVSMLTMRGHRRCRVMAVSGVQKPDRRSSTVQCIERLANSRIQSLEPEWFDSGSGDATDPQLQSYFDETNARFVGLLPLMDANDSHQTSRRLGTVVAEIFDPDGPTDEGLLRSRSNWLVRHASNSVRNAVHVHRLPLLGVSRWFDRNVTHGRRIPWITLVAVGLVAALSYVAMLPTRFEIDARGKLIPAIRESIYAPRPGTVVDLPYLDAGSADDERTQEATVQPGDVLVRLENADLDYELTTLLGEEATVQQQLQTIAATIGQFAGRDEQSRDRYEELTAQSAELKVRQSSIARRIRLVQRERDKLSVKATIQGRVLTWDVVNELKLRPVQQGDFLLEIVDVEGPWEIDLYVRDRHIGYVQRAQQDSQDDQPLAVSFFQLSDPEMKFRGEVHTMGSATDVYPEYGSAVRLTGAIDPDDSMADFRPGTTLAAKIDCGRKPWAFVLAYDLIHTIRMWGLF